MVSDFGGIKIQDNSKCQTEDNCRKKNRALFVNRDNTLRSGETKHEGEEK